MKVDSHPAELPHFVGPGNPKIFGAPGRLHGPHQKEPVKSIQRPHSRTVFYSLSHCNQKNDLQKARNPETLYQFLLQDTHRHDLADLQRDARPQGFPVSKKVMKIDNIKKKHIYIYIHAHTYIYTCIYTYCNHLKYSLLAKERAICSGIYGVLRSICFPSIIFSLEFVTVTVT